jgi:hypothetical protein
VTGLIAHLFRPSVSIQVSIISLANKEKEGHNLEVQTEKMTQNLKHDRQKEEQERMQRTIRKEALIVTSDVGKK